MLYFFQVPLLRIINGTNGSRSGHDIIQSVVDAIICPSVQRHFTWTGKTNKRNQKKEKFNALKEIHSLIFRVCHDADREYTHAKCKDDMIKKVMKYAHSKGNDDDDVEVSRNPEQTSQNDKGDFQSAGASDSWYSYFDNRKHVHGHNQNNEMNSYHYQSYYPREYSY